MSATKAMRAADGRKPPPSRAGTLMKYGNDMRMGGDRRRSPELSGVNSKQQRD